MGDRLSAMVLFHHTPSQPPTCCLEPRGLGDDVPAFGYVTLSHQLRKPAAAVRARHPVMVFEAAATYAYNTR